MKPRVAIVGSGVSGLVCAYLLREAYDVTVYEAGSWVGGHTHTVDVEDASRGSIAIDTGFIVFNDKTYPNFIRLLERLGVASQESEMSFSVHEERSGLEWNGRDLSSIFVQKRNLARPSFLGMLRDIMRFNKSARALARSEDEIRLGDYLARERYGRAFRERYLVPMAAAIWSTDHDAMMDFPARFLARFFENHGFLEIDDRPQWRVICGGSRSYVDAILRELPGRVHTDSPVRSVRREEAGVGVEVARRAGGGVFGEVFDRVILATHADQSLALLADASADERDILGALPYTQNRTTLHTGRMLLPKRRRAVASWNSRVCADGQRVRLCYHMNTLQSLATETDYCVSLNSDDEIPGDARLGSWDYEHPLFTRAGVAAQARWAEIDGVRNTHFVGAYWRNGFHEDGVVSALRVCEKLGATL